MSWRAAIADDDVEALKVALQGNLELVDEYSSRTPLRQAAFENKLTCVKWLLDEGADVNSVNREGWSALHLCVWRDHTTVAWWLLQAGANQALLTSHLQSALILCLQRDVRGCGRLLLDRGANCGLPDNVPLWANDFLLARKRCSRTALLVVGIHRWRRNAMAGNGRDVVRLIAQIVWEGRFLV